MSTDRQQEFKRVYINKLWKADETISGPNSMIINSQSAREGIQYCIDHLSVTHITDIGCGDFIWMKDIVKSNESISYIGLDIVPELIQDNKKKYLNHDFYVHDFCVDSLCYTDLIIVRDVFIHLSLADIQLALENIRSTDFKYILSTTYMAVTENIEMPRKRQMYHPVNLSLSPFNFRDSIKLFDNQTMVEKNTNKTESISVPGRYLGLWKREDIL